ncbi:effector-binding domain-containing protein [Alkalispirochaeta americana]|uniref:Effector-binding domain-containing protein n=1 Tax=Alkalispirochaeta americana TaxID=159291 RepID=A0A1N6V0F4_9SPIO|nr:GyrI-like domain-containing protein [Alkalispirochaeta americana]SIQ71345.1 effector-binding domain-containing protein [Alkalispirochaeta americana]
MEIKERQEEKTVSIRTTVSLHNLPDTLTEVYGELMEYLQRQKETMTGYPFVMYHNHDMEALDIEAGFPVEKVLPDEGRVRASRIPGGKVLSAVHTGPYTTLEKSYTPLMTHIEETGLKVTPWMYELYLNCPDETPPEKLQTEICFPLAE